jgi:hypothetical protein
MIALSGVLIVLSVVAAATGLMCFFQGAKSVPGADHVNPAIDSDLRFYSAYWLGYSALCAWVALNLPERIDWVPFLAVTLLLSATGRLLSLTQTGSPGRLYTLYMAAEFAIAVVLATLYFM